MYRTLGNLAALCLIACAAVSCRPTRSQNTPLRPEKISVYLEETPSHLINNLQVPFDGVENGRMHVVSDRKLDWRSMMDPNLPEAEKNWFTITNVQEVEPNHLVFDYQATSVLKDNSLSRRAGDLSLYNAEANLGKFMTVRQGYVVTYDAGFDLAAPNGASLSGNMVYTTPALNNINLHYYDYISFNAYATTSYDPVGTSITMDITLEGAPVFEATGLKTMRVNVPVGTEAEPSNLQYFLLSNGGERIGAGVKLAFSTSNPSGTIVHLTNLRVYKVSEAELEDLFDEEEDYNPDNENW